MEDLAVTTYLTLFMDGHNFCNGPDFFIIFFVADLAFFFFIVPKMP